MATTFVQGRLRNERLSVEIETSCAHCGQELHITVDSEMHWSVKEHDAQPLLFMPEVNWAHFEGPNIIGRY